MNRHYFTDNSDLEGKKKNIKAGISGGEIEFVTGGGVFSKSRLDYGSELLINTVLKNGLRENARVLDLGCGWGAVGVSICTELKSVTAVLTDINPKAVGLAQENIKKHALESRAEAVVGNGYENIIGEFDYILTNPPIRAGKAVVYSFFEGAPLHLKQGGCLYVVIRKRQGADSAVLKIREVFGNAETVARSGGYHILRAVRNRTDCKKGCRLFPAALCV